MGKQEILRVEDLDFFIDSVQILRSVTFSIKEGEIVCLLGRNGAGKTSIIKNIIGLYTPRSGKIILNDEEITFLSPRKRVLKGLAYSPEDLRIFADLL